MKICLVTYEFPPFIYGGAGTYAKQIAKHLGERGNEVHVLAFGNYGNAPMDKNVIRHPLGNRSLPKFFWIPSYWISLYRNYRRIEEEAGGFDVFIGNGFSELPIPRRLVRVPRITVMHQSAKRVIKRVKPSFVERITNLNNEMGIAALFDPILVGRADKIVAVSNHVRESLMDDLGMDDRKIEVIYNGFNDFYKEMEPEAYKSSRERYAGDEKRIILFVGRINDKRKGLAELLKAFSLIKDKANASLLVVGPGDRAKISRLVASLGLEGHVNVLGKVSDEELHTLYSVCDIYVSNSFYESFGLTLAEAMSAKKPIIARDIGGISEVASDENGILLKNDSIEGLSDAILGMINNMDKYKAIGEGNREYALNKFSWEKAAKKLESVATELLEERKV